MTAIAEALARQEAATVASRAKGDGSITFEMRTAAGTPFSLRGDETKLRARVDWPRIPVPCSGVVIAREVATEIEKKRWNPLPTAIPIAFCISRDPDVLARSLVTRLLHKGDLFYARTVMALPAITRMAEEKHARESRQVRRLAQSASDLRNYLDDIHIELDGEPWNLATLKRIAEILRNADYEVREPGLQPPPKLP
jgi:hypothetical protein